MADTEGEAIKAYASPDSYPEKQTGSDVESHHGAFDKTREAKLMRRIDWRLLPILGALYSISLIDRTNVCKLVVERNICKLMKQ